MKRENTYLICIATFLLLLTPLAVHAANPFDEMKDQLDVVQDSVDTVQGVVNGIAADVSSLQDSVDSINTSLAGMSHGLNVEVRVDTAYCASIGVQCANHDYTAADSGNHNPIRVFIQVTNHAGAAVNGLDLTAFSASNPFVPAGGGTAVICDDVSCGSDNFFAGTNGLYTLFLDRGPVGNWKSGMYGGSVKVSTGDGKSGIGMMTFTID
ncbi:MAG: hypothetical protein OEX12_04310 [Gammaproteobacteria bacterium]|nr:hypothetical protein [Gammaproteobacteria bacterium]